MQGVGLPTTVCIQIRRSTVLFELELDKALEEFGDLDAQIELHTNVNLPSHLYQLGELYRLLCRVLQVFD